MMHNYEDSIMTETANKEGADFSSWFILLAQKWYHSFSNCLNSLWQMDKNINNYLIVAIAFLRRDDLSNNFPVNADRNVLRS